MVRFIAAVLLVSTALSGTAFAQSAPTGPPPLHSTVDSNGVDLISGDVRWSMTEAVIGSGEGAVSLDRIWGDSTFRDNWSGGLYTSGGITYVQLGNISDAFTKSGSVYTSVKANGSTLVQDASGFGYTYTASDGTRITFFSGNAFFPVQVYSCPVTTAGSCAIPGTITRPNGEEFSLQWGIAEGRAPASRIRPSPATARAAH